jgi:hypothetical protein
MGVCHLFRQVIFYQDKVKQYPISIEIINFEGRSNLTFPSPNMKDAVPRIQLQ